MPTEQYTYYAFVSYRSSDEKWAKWLQEKIESYRLPTTVQRMSASLPTKRLRPCFRYHTDIQPNELKTELHRKLEQSRYLLVICSPRSAQSPWVGAEIDTFVQLGRRDRIIPVIVEGTPYSADPATECYNPSLLKHFPHSDNIDDDHEILGVNIHEEGAGSAYMKRERAVIQIVSRMLGVNFDQLWQRQRRRLIRRAILLTAIVLLTLAALIATWVINQPFNVRIQLTEASPVCSSLPPMHDAIVRLQLPEEERCDTLSGWNEQALFRYLPARLKNTEAEVYVSAPDYLPLDTIVLLGEPINLPLRRDESVYGLLRATVFLGEQPMADAPLLIADTLVSTDAQGRFFLHVPLSRQQKAYTISTPDRIHTATLFAPCGENDIVFF